MQGGLLPAGAPAGADVEIACDESGFSGTNLLHPAMPVITHASVDLSPDEALRLMSALRSRFRFSARELKSGQFLRGLADGGALEWLLAALNGRAHVHVVDKELFLVTRIVDVLLAEPSYAAEIRLAQGPSPAAVALYRAGRSAGSEWDAFLTAFGDLVRLKHQRPGRRAVERFFEARDALIRKELGVAAEAVLAKLSPARVQAVLTRLIEEDRSIPPPLEPMLSALAETVLFWSAESRRVLVIHDEQSALTADRLTRLQQALADAKPLPGGVSPLAGLVMADSRNDPRVQVADLLAGIARRLPNRGKESPLRPFLSATSLHDPDSAQTQTADDGSTIESSGIPCA